MAISMVRFIVTIIGRLTQIRANFTINRHEREFLPKDMTEIRKSPYKRERNRVFLSPSLVWQGHAVRIRGTAG